jgi:hypothetical protein
MSGMGKAGASVPDIYPICNGAIQLKQCEIVIRDRILVSIFRRCHQTELNNVGITVASKDKALT